MKRLFPIVAACAALAAVLPATAQTSATPPPPPPALNNPAPAVSATPAPALTLPPEAVPKPKASGTPAPLKDTDVNRIGISGVWEVQIQRDSGTTYTHFKLVQNGSVLTGQYLDANGKKYPLAGSIDGKVVRVVVSLPDGTSIVFAGSQDGGTDMMGMVQFAKESTGFTAAYRPKYKWIDNIAPGAGMGTPY